MSQKSLVNTVAFVLKKPFRLPELLHKFTLRFSRKNTDRDLDWIRDNQVSFKAWAQNLDSELWKESEAFSATLKSDAQKTLASIPVKLGGGGLYPILYFLTRYRKPQVIVETGVAAGFSSKTFLSALKRNGGGHLYSSDFPYFRIAEAEKYIGILVDESLKKDWSLYIEGDSKNIPRILAEIDRIDLFHYDSDKSYESRTRIFRMIESRLHSESYIMFDDIQNNNHFRDMVKSQSLDFYVFEFEGKHVGLIYNYKS